MPGCASTTRTSAAVHERVPAPLPRLARAPRVGADALRRPLPQRRPVRAAATASSATGRRRTACRSTSAASTATAGATTGTRSSPSRRRGSCWSRRSSTCCSRPRESASRPRYAAEMMAYDPTAGELRTHYAGFFDPGFGYDPSRRRHGSRAALGGARPRRLLHGRAPPAGLQVRLEWMSAPADASTARPSGPTTRAR